MSFDLIIPFLRPIESLLLDESVSEIMGNPDGSWWSEREGVVQREAGVKMDANSLRVGLEVIANKMEKRLDADSPLLHVQLPDGSRLAAVMPPVAKPSPAVTIRKFTSRRFTVEDLIARGSLTRPLADFLAARIAEGKTLLISGGTGTGKTQLLKSLVYQITKDASENQGKRPNILILDYKRDYSSEEFVKATNAKVIKPQNLPLNLFDLSQASDSMTPWLDRFNFFADVLDKVYSGIGPVQRQLLKGAVRSVYQGRLEPSAPTIYDVHAAYQTATNGKADSISAIIEEMVDRELFSRDAQDASASSFLNGVVVVSLDALGQDDRAKNLLVAIMLNLFYDNMLKIEKRPFYGQDPQKRVIDSFLLVDEADNIMQYEFDVLRKILLQGREFGVGVILASQYLSHFKARSTDYREMLLTWLVHKVPSVLAPEIIALGMTGNQIQTAERIKSLGLHECLFKTFNVPGEFVKGVPFYQLMKK